MFIDFNAAFAAAVGLIIDASIDLIALAPCAAGTPDSFNATRNVTKSL